MKYLKNTGILILLAVLLFACEKTIKIEIPDNGRRLVVNSFFGQDSVMKINLTKSKYILDGSSDYSPVLNAKITLYEEGVRIEELTDLLDGNYIGHYKLKNDVDYKVEVTAEGFPLASAENSIPGKTEILNIDAYETMDMYGWPEYNFKLTFKDDVNAENYYFIQVMERRYVTYTLDDGSDTTFIEDNRLYLQSDDPIAFSDDWYLEEGVIFNDEVINGKEYTIWFKGNSYYYDNNESRSVYYIIFKTVSKEFYRYYISLAKHMNAQGEIFMEPVQVYTNIENGFGIFAGYSADVDSVIIQN